MDKTDLTLKNLLLYSYGCRLCQEKALDLFYDIDFNADEAFEMYKNIFCKKCIAAKFAIEHEKAKETIDNWRKNIKL